MNHCSASKIIVTLFVLSLSSCSIEAQVDSTDGILFLVQKPPKGERVVMEALYIGSVVEIEGCLRASVDLEGHTIVWPPGFSMATEGDKYIVKNEEGVKVGTIGESFEFGGGEVSTLWEGIVDDATRTAALNRCPGKYWIVGEFPLKTGTNN